MAKSGIYRIDGPSGKFYVGSAQSISRRWIEHKRDLRKGDHANPKLQCAWNCHGESAFRISVLEVVADLSKLLEREQHWLDALDAVGAGYNVMVTAGSRYGMKASEETKKRMSDAHKGRKHGPMSEEQKAYYSQLYKGRKLSEETRRKMGEARRGKPRPESVKEALRKANTGRKLSDETKRKIAEARSGSKASEETKARMRAAHAARRQSFNQV